MEQTQEKHDLAGGEATTTLLTNLEASEKHIESAAEDRAGHDERRKAERKEYKDKRRFNAASFVPSASHPYTERLVELKTSYAQKLFLGLFPRAQLSTYGIQVMLQIVGRNDDIDEVEGIVKKLLDKQIEEIKKESARLSKILKDNGVHTIVHYTDGRTVATKVYAPNASRVLKLLEDYDHMNQVADTLWHADLLTSTQRKSVSSAWRRAITKLIKELHNIYVRSKSSARRSADQREKEIDERRRLRAQRPRRAAPADAGSSEDAPVVDVLGDTPQSLAA